MSSITSLFLCFFLISPIFAAEHDFEIIHWGKVIQVPSDKIDDFFGYSYVLTVRKGDQTYGYPIEPKNKKVEEQVQKLKGQFVKVVGNIGRRQVRDVERGRTLDVIFLAELEKFPVSNLKVSIKNDKVLDQGMDPMPLPKAVMKKKGSGVSDKVTNAILFGTGAVLMGNLIKTMLEK